MQEENMYRILNLSFIFVLCFFTSIRSLALPEDSEEKLYIVADKTLYNYKTGMNTFEGHVKVDQGATHLRADRLITKDNRKHQIQEVIAYGVNEQAHYWTLPKKGDLEMHAHAEIIKYYPIEAHVVLQKNVLITQGENSFQGQLILYNRKDQTITVPASENGQ